jgi:phage-related tail protein
MNWFFPDNDGAFENIPNALGGNIGFFQFQLLIVKALFSQALNFKTGLKMDKVKELHKRRSDDINEIKREINLIASESKSADKLVEIRKKMYQAIVFLNHPKVAEFYRAKGKNSEQKLNELKSLLGELP